MFFPGSAETHNRDGLAVRDAINEARRQAGMEPLGGPEPVAEPETAEAGPQLDYLAGLIADKLMERASAQTETETGSEAS